MQYVFQLLPHANIHYQESQGRLGAAELRCMMQPLGLLSDVTTTKIGGADFLTFDAPALTTEQLAALAKHSALLLLCERRGELLLPLDVPQTDYLPKDLAEVLKYKGKTSTVFTRMMINCALSACAFARKAADITVLDPICGRGTTAFCAVQAGMNAVGVDVDRKDVKEAVDYFGRYAQYHKLKHFFGQSSRTVGGRSVPEAAYTFADTREHYQAGEKHSLRFFLADTADCAAIMKKSPADILVGDLPYGIQHAPMDGRKPEGFEQLLRRALPAWLQCLKPGGAMALSFNKLTLRKDKLIGLMQDTGWTPLTEAPYDAFEHFVEQAVTRDFVVARRA